MNLETAGDCTTVLLNEFDALLGLLVEFDDLLGVYTGVNRIGVGAMTD